MFRALLHRLSRRQSLRDRLHRFADGLFLMFVVPPAFQKGQILSATVICRIQEHLQSVLDPLGIELAQKFGTTLIHPF